MRCYICGKDVDPEHPDPLKRRVWGYTARDGSQRKICDGCNEKLIESSINSRYKAQGRKSMMDHNKKRKEMGAY